MYGKSNSMYRCMWNDVIIRKLLWNKYSFIRSFINRYSSIFIQENAFENVVCELASILSLPQCVKNEDLLHQCELWSVDNIGSGNGLCLMAPSHYLNMLNQWWLFANRTLGYTTAYQSINQSNPVLLKERVHIPRTRRAGGAAMLWGRLPLDGVGSCRLFFTDDLHNNLSWVPVWYDIFTPLYSHPGLKISYDIFTPGWKYRYDIFTPLTIFSPPSQ